MCHSILVFSYFRQLSASKFLYYVTLEWHSQFVFQLKEGGKKSSFSSFNDSTLSDGRTIIDLIDCIRRGMINYDLVKDGSGEEASYMIV